MTFVEGNGIPCHEAAHDFAEWGRAGTYEKVTMVRDQRPCITLGLCLFQDNSQTIQEGFSVLIVPEDFTAFDAAGHYPAERGTKGRGRLVWLGEAFGLTIENNKSFIFRQDRQN